MKKPQFKMVKLTDVIPDEKNAREADKYFPEGCAEGSTPEERAANAGRTILEAGTMTIPAFQLVKRENGLVAKDGNRRYWELYCACKADNKSMADIEVPALIYSDLTESEELELAISANVHSIKPGMWSQSTFVRRLERQGKKQTDIASKLGCTAPMVNRLSVLAAMPEWIVELGMAGKLATDLVLKVYDSQKGKRNQKIDATIKALEAQRDALEAETVSADSFGIVNRIEQIKADAANKALLGAAVSKYEKTYKAVEEGLKDLSGETQAAIKADFIKLQVPSDCSGEYKDKSAIERNELSTKYLEVLLEDIKAAKAAQNNGMPAPKGATGDGTKTDTDGNTGDKNQGDGNDTQPQPPGEAQDNKREVQTMPHALVGAFLSKLFGDLCESKVAPDKRIARARTTIAEFNKTHKFWE